MQEINRTLLCTRCIARFSGIRDPLVSISDRENTALKIISEKGLSAVISPTDPEMCDLCGGILYRLDELSDALLKQIGEREFSSFLIGSTEIPKQMDLEERVSKALDIESDRLKKELNRELGKKVQEKTGKEASFDDPDIIVNFDFSYFSFRIQVKSLYIYGTYRKLERGIPQTRWIHRSGEDNSVETKIGKPLLSMAGGTEYHLHGAGREDVDVRMLGNGREFVIEAVEPVKRKIDTGELERLLNSNGGGIQVSGLRYSSRDEVVRIKNSTNSKSYRTVVRSQSPIDVARMRDASLILTGKDIYQRTPLRVTGSRSDLVRKRRVMDCHLESVSNLEAVLKIRAESGTYIKELINGDSGRTEPNLSKLYGQDLEVKELDVIWIHRDGE
jgi:tRNA pseudouridine synthase 10